MRHTPEKSSLSFIRITILAAALALLLPAVAMAELPGIQITITGAEATEGTFEVSLFDSAESFMKEPFLQMAGVPQEDGSVSAEFVGLVEGDYAVVVVHDANGNGAFDSGFLGIGSEAYGFSNDVRPWFGWPEFEEVRIRVEDPETPVSIRLE
ncbi:MAG: DUF2141 domain-containing protein [Gammaproteobacteria bacterium]|nr:DUF2141 domain-containing protein [Gammaproteobacteria bacterium]